MAAAHQGDRSGAVVSRGGRPDLAGYALPRVQAPTLLIVGGRDRVVIGLNRQAEARLRCEHRFETVPGATHLFEERGALDQVATLAAGWCTSLPVCLLPAGEWIGERAGPLARSGPGRRDPAVGTAAALDRRPGTVGGAGGDAQLVLLGEASHGTAEFYGWRAALTRRLIAERGFSFVAVEGDWPDCFAINR